MPWKETCVMDERAELVLAAREENRNMAALCRVFGISRKTGYKWMERYEAEGLVGLKDLSRRPHKIPHETKADVVCEIVKIRTAYPSWGPKKIRAILRRTFRRKKLPAANTIGNVLKRCGLLDGRRRRKQTGLIPQERPCVTPDAPNDVWTIDFKGWWLTGDGTRCNPLTIRDEFCRYILEISALDKGTVEAVQPRFEAVFRKYGLPDTIRMDNGTPFVAKGVVGLTRLSAWFIRLGIKVDRTRPAHPQDNGGHERMHRDMKGELQKKPANSLHEEQERFDLWKREFNTIRPHEALGMKTPAEIYRRSVKRFPKHLPKIEYPASYSMRSVRHDGYIKWNGTTRYVSQALAGEKVGLERMSDTTMRLWYCDVQIGELDLLGASPLRPTASEETPREVEEV